MRDNRKFRGRSESVREARRFVTGTLAGQPRETVEAAELMVSELATNCVRHAHSDFEISVEISGLSIRVEARDSGPGRPTPQNPAPTEPTGRGLRIVEALSDSWGTLANPSGKTVWFEIALQPGASGDRKGDAAAEERSGGEPSTGESVQGPTIERRRSTRTPRLRSSARELCEW